MNVRQMDDMYIAGTYARHDVTFVSGEGALLFDENGGRYIDLGGGIAVNTFGAADKAWAEAVCKQARTLQHTSNYYYTAPQAALAGMLAARTGMKKVFFSNSGAEANECAIKVARKYAHGIYGDARPNIVTLVNSFHGRTVTTLSATGQEAFHTNFGPFTPGFLHVPANDLEAMRAVLSSGNVCAVMLEFVQGEGGVVPLDETYVKGVAQLAQEKDILLIADEVQTGNGRTGKLYAYMHYGVQPDIVSTAKGLAGGLPFGATLLFTKVEHVLDAGSHGSTFGGNPVCAAAALSVLERLDAALMEEVVQKGAYIEAALLKAPGVIAVSGKGLMLGIETAAPAGEILQRCLKRGLLVLTAKTKIRLVPPLNIPMLLLEEAITILKEEIAK